MNYTIHSNKLYFHYNGSIAIDFMDAKVFNTMVGATSCLTDKVNKYSTIVYDEWEIIECGMEIDFRKMLLDNKILFDHHWHDQDGIKYLMRQPITKYIKLFDHLTKYNFTLKPNIEELILESKLIRKVNKEVEDGVTYIKMLPVDQIVKLLKTLII